jgi:uncharacterized MnhB-related membrane protein
MAIRGKHLLVSAIWLAGSSAFVALLLFRMGAPEIAVIELSVGAGLVTVLFVFAINITGEDASAVIPSIPRPFAWIVVGIAVVLLGWMVLPAIGIGVNLVDKPFTVYLWQDRRLDTLLQVSLIFAGVMGVLSLLTETHESHVNEEKA